MMAISLLMNWKVAEQNKQGNNYKYDYRSWLKSVDYYESGKNGDYSTTYSYIDDRGNFDVVSRMSPDGMIDDLQYQYFTGSNKLQSITDGGSASLKSQGFKSKTSDDYIQDADGFITYDAETGATLIRDHNDLTSKISFPNDEIVITNHRDANGVIHGRVIDSSGIIKTLNNIGSVEYRNGIPSIIGHGNGFVTFDYGKEDELFLTGTVNHTKTEEAVDIYSNRTMIGTNNEINKAPNSISLQRDFEVSTGAIYCAIIEPLVLQGVKYYYSIKDHLGSPRVVFSDVNNNNAVIASEITDIKNFYPFGLEWEPSQGVQKYRNAYNDKEAISYTNYLEFEARGYIKSINLFDGPDPISDQFPHLSTTNYAGLSPVTNIDLWGLQPVASFTAAKIRRMERDGMTAAQINQEGKKDLMIAVAVISPVDEVAIGVGAASRLPVIGGLITKAGSALSKLGGRISGAFKSLFRSSDNIPDVPVTNQIYKRPNNATTKAQRESVQDQPCVDCGATGQKNVADHKYELVKEHYETGKIDKTQMKSIDAVQPQCPTCSSKQGAEMSKYSKEMKKIIKERTENG